MCASFEYFGDTDDGTVDAEGKIKKNLLLFIYLFIIFFSLHFGKS